MKPRLLVLIGAYISSAAASPSFAVTVVVGDGGNLGAAVAAAHNQDIIEIQSNGVYAENLGWQNKYLTIRAGIGFHPTIQGGIGRFAGNSNTGGTFQGLNVTGGLYAGDTGTSYAKIVVENSTFHGRMDIGGTGNARVDATFSNSEFFGELFVDATGSFDMFGTMNHNIFHSYTNLSALDENTYNVQFNDNDFLGRVYTSNSASLDHRTLTFFRNRLRQGIDLGAGSFNNLVVQMSDNVIGDSVSSPPVATAGILLHSIYDTGYANKVTATFINNTVIGFGTGIEVRGFTQATTFAVEFDNMLLATPMIWSMYP